MYQAGHSLCVGNEGLGNGVPDGTLSGEMLNRCKCNTFPICWKTRLAWSNPTEQAWWGGGEAFCILEGKRWQLLTGSRT